MVVTPFRGFSWTDFLLCETLKWRAVSGSLISVYAVLASAIALDPKIDEE
jgi:hypothetical protein